MTDIPEALRSLVRASASPPSAAALETEVRSQGAPNFKAEGNNAIRNEIPTQAAWEWTYGVPATAITAFINFLRVNELEMIKDMRRITASGSAPWETPPGEGQENRTIFYRGTFVSATSENGWYECRTVWAYSGSDPVAQWNDLLGDAIFRDRFVALRARWANDPGAKERLVSLLQLYRFPEDFVDPNNEAAHGAILAATVEASSLTSGP